MALSQTELAALGMSTQAGPARDKEGERESVSVCGP